VVEVVEAIESKEQETFDDTLSSEYAYPTTTSPKFNLNSNNWLTRPLDLFSVKNKIRNSTQQLIQVNSHDYTLEEYAKTIEDYVLPSSFKFSQINTTVIEPVWKKISSPRFRDNASYNIQSISPDEGLPSSQINDIHKDSRGFTWLATPNGLLRYNGSHIKHYQKENGLLENEINCIEEDSAGNIWLGLATNIVVRFDGRTFSHYRLDSLNPVVTIGGIAFDQNGDVWCTANFGGIVHIKADSYELFNKNQGVIDHRPIPNISVDKNNQVWATGFGKGIYLIKNDTLRNLDRPVNTYLHNFLLEDSSVLIAPFAGFIAELKNDKYYKYYYDFEPQVGYIDAVKDKFGNYWLTTALDGFVMWDRKELKIFSTPDGLLSDNVINVTRDGDDLLFGTTDQGFFTFKPQSFHFLKEKDGLPDDLVYHISQNTKNEYLIGTAKGMVTLNDSTSRLITSYDKEERFEKPGLSSLYYNVLDIYSDSSDLLLMTYSNHGIIVTNNENSKMGVLGGNMKNGPQNPSSIARTSDGKYWIGSHSGGHLHVIKNDSMFYFTTEDQLLTNKMVDLLADHNDNLWIATEDYGVICLEDQSQFRYYNEKDGLPSIAATTLFEDNQHNIWVGTEKGLAVKKKNEKKFEPILFPEYIKSNSIKAILQDKLSRFWITTDKGLIMMTLDEQLNPIFFDYFDKSRGLINHTFLPNSIHIDHKNRLMAGTEGGLMTLQLDHYVPENDIPKVLIESISINGKPQSFREQGELQFTDVTPFLNLPEELELNHHQNHIVFNFSSFESNRSEISYHYFLEGFDDNWNTTAESFFAEYKNLDYGMYTFQLKASLQNGLESEVLSYSFQILTPWWHTTWARILYGLSSLLIIILIVKWRTRSLIRRQKDLELKIEIATKDLRKEKEMVEEQKATIEEAHNEIKDSIIYAKRIQSAILPSDKSVREHLKNSFIFYRPKDIVAGDFYWLEASGDTVYFAAADCTGHGVPGAMVSVICNGGLNRSVREFSLIKPGDILHKTRELVLQEFEKSEEDVKDGMDIALCKIKGTVLSYSGANNPLWIIRNGEVLERKADKQPIGKHMDNKPFTTHTMELEKGDTLYVFSDGYSDQFGGPRGKKYKSGNFKKFLLSIQPYTMEEQYTLLNEEFERWRGELDQLDDVCIIGVRI